MANLIMPFLMPMILGRTIDLRTYTIGGSIYDDNKYLVTPVKTMNSTYHVLQDDSYPYTSFGIPLDVALRIKSDYVTTRSGIMGLSGLLKDTSWKYNSVVVGMVSLYLADKRFLKDDPTFIPDWKDKIPRTQTHYTHAVTYGEWCTTLFKFQCDIPGDIQVVRKTLTNVLGTSGKIDDNMTALWNKALSEVKENKDIRGQVKVSVTTFTTISLPSEITSLESYIEVSKDIPKRTSLGQPIYMTLRPLSEVDDEFDKVKGNYELMDDLRKMDDMYDDVKITKDRLVKWTTDTSVLFSDEDEERIYTLMEKINSCIRSLQRVNEDVSLYKDMDRSNLDLAFHQYLKGLEREMGTYYLAYIKLREEIDASCEDNFLHKIRGLLRVSEEEMVKKGKVKGGLEECEKYCTQDKRCRAIGYADHISELDLTTGMYFREENQCWIYYRSTNTANVHTPNGLSGDMGVYDRKCYL